MFFKKKNTSVSPEFANVPNHVAIIMDGNGRWAKSRGLPRFAGHIAGEKTFEEILYVLKDAGVKTVTVYAFSTENWKRPESEVTALIGLITKILDTAVDKCKKNGARLRFIGDKSAFSPSLAQKMCEAEEATVGFEYNINVALNYGSRQEIVRAANLSMERFGKITEETISACLYTSEVGDPDLIIRTGAEIRLSNFLLWQAAYSEMYFTDVLWPDFDAEELGRALDKFSKTERRYGGVKS